MSSIDKNKHKQTKNPERSWKILNNPEQFSTILKDSGGSLMYRENASNALTDPDRS